VVVAAAVDENGGQGRRDPYEPISRERAARRTRTAHRGAAFVRRAQTRATAGGGSFGVRLDVDVAELVSGKNTIEFATTNVPTSYPPAVSKHRSSWCRRDDPVAAGDGHHRVRRRRRRWRRRGRSSRRQVQGPSNGLGAAVHGRADVDRCQLAQIAALGGMAANRIRAASPAVVIDRTTGDVTRTSSGLRAVAQRGSRRHVHGKLYVTTPTGLLASGDQGQNLAPQGVASRA